MTHAASILKSIMILQTRVKIKNYTAEEIQGMADELGMSLHDMIVDIINILIDIYARGACWSRASSPGKRLELIFKNEQALSKQPYSAKDLQEVEQNLGLSGEQLLAVVAGQLVRLYEKNTELIGIINQQKDEIYSRDLKIQCLNSRIEDTGKSIKKVTQAELIRKKAVAPAKKSNITIEQIKQLDKLGYTDEQIARTLGVSRSTVWRRRKEEEAALAAKNIPF